jgi:hypothetical protein
VWHSIPRVAVLSLSDFPLGCCDHSIPRVAVLNLSDFSIGLLWSQHTVCNSDNGKETLNHCGGAWEFLNLIRVYNKELTFTSPLPQEKGQTDRQTETDRQTARRVLQTGSNWQTEMVVNDMKVQLAFDFIHCNSFTFLDHLFLHRLQPSFSFFLVCVCVCVCIIEGWRWVHSTL